MKVLVTGGAGFIGSATARALVARGDEVRVLDALTQPVHEPGAQPDFEDFVHGDVRDRSAWQRALDGVEAVLHAAAYQDYMTDFSTFFAVNAAGTALMYEVIIAEQLPVRRIVIASSQSVYGEGAARCTSHGTIVPDQRTAAALARGDWKVYCSRCEREVTPVATPEELAEPRNPYGISKLAAETVALALGAQHGIETVALRYAIVHGAGQSPHNAYSGLLRSACTALLAGRAPIVFEDGAQLRDYIAIEDVVAANLLALDHERAPGAAYNVGGAQSWSVLEVLEALNEIVPEPRVPEMPGVYRVGDARHTIGDCTKLRTLGWEPGADLRGTWKTYWDWLAERNPGDTAKRAYEEMRARGVIKQGSIKGSS